MLIPAHLPMNMVAILRWFVRHIPRIEYEETEAQIMPTGLSTRSE